MERRRIETVGGAHERSIVDGRLAGGAGDARVDTGREAQSVAGWNLKAPVRRRPVQAGGSHRAVTVHDDQRVRGVAAPIHRDAVLLDVVETETPRSADQVEADRRLPGDDLTIAVFGDRPRSAELKARIVRPRHDVDDAADGIRAESG